jgi:hypothetical protein
MVSLYQKKFSTSVLLFRRECKCGAILSDINMNCNLIVTFCVIIAATAAVARGLALAQR